MSDRIDHATRALALSQNEYSDPRNGPIAAAVQAEAQVHATLALVEQQRIANLIALAQYRSEDGEGAVLRTRFDVAISLRAEAARALGVSDD